MFHRLVSYLLIMVAFFACTRTHKNNDDKSPAPAIVVEESENGDRKPTAVQNELCKKTAAPSTLSPAPMNLAAFPSLTLHVEALPGCLQQGGEYQLGCSTNGMEKWVSLDKSQTALDIDLPGLDLCNIRAWGYPHPISQCRDDIVMVKAYLTGKACVIGPDGIPTEMTYKSKTINMSGELFRQTMGDIFVIQPSYFGELKANIVSRSVGDTARLQWPIGKNPQN